MSPNQLDEAAIFDIARRITSHDVRADYVLQACGSNTALQVRVEALLDALDKEPSFLDAAPSAVDLTEQLSTVDEKPGMVIGRYKLMEQIGEGGFGVVYVAEQEKPVRRKVALKIIKPGMDTKEVIARFEAERQALALMDHPNIAKVLDAGATDSGRPYFVMELVRGIPITEYTDRKNLGTRQRLELFVAVCQAMQHAHQKGIIHRDVKPSNVLITEHDGTPLPKVIDFGVAKATNQRLTEMTIYTRHHQMVGTPLYMSPEQAELSGLDVDTRTDIYSLGVLLYELLTGATPFDRKRFHEAAYDEIRRIIREEEPPKPSTRVSTLGDDTGSVVERRKTDLKKLGSVLRGELDWIVMKAIEKDRSRRYETANAFAEDIKRHLANEPVLAGPPSNLYRFRKLVHRRRGLVCAVSAIALALTIGFSAAVAGFVDAGEKRALAQAAESLANAKSIEAKRERDNANEERKRAEVEVEKVRKVLNLFKDMLRSGIPWANVTENSNDAQYTVRQMLMDFSERFDKEFDGDPEVGAEVWDIVGNANLNDLPWAEAAFRRALELRRRAFDGDDGGLPVYLWSLGKVLTDPAQFEQAQIGAAEAELLFHEAQQIFDKVGYADSKSTTPFLITMALGWSVFLQGRFDEAESILLGALKKKAAPQEMQNHLAAWAHHLVSVCISLSDRTRLGEALQHSETALQLKSGEKGQAYRFALVVKATCLLDQSRMSEADACFAEILELAEQYKEDERLSSYVVMAINRRMRTLSALGRSEDAKASLEQLRAVCQRQNKPLAEAFTLRFLADIAVCEGDHDQTEARLRDAVNVTSRSQGMRSILTVKAQMDLAQHYRLLGHHDKADVIYRQVFPYIEDGLRDTDENPLWLSELAKAKSFCSDSTAGEIAESIQLAMRAMETASRFERNSLQNALANAHVRSEEFTKAIAVLREGLSDRHVVLMSQWLPLEALLERVLREHGSAFELEGLLRGNIDYREKLLPLDHPVSLEAKVHLVDWLLEQGRTTDASAMLESCERLARHEETTTERRRLAMKTLVRAYEASEQPEESKVWQAELVKLEAN